jgi:excinuclease ABC subunit C
MILKVLRIGRVVKTTFLKNLTKRPGIYKMLNEAGDVLYVGKARNLKSRVTSYFRAEGLSSKIQSLMSQVASVDVIVTHTENEALLLENNLIKQLKPRYNVLLRDDKSYPYIFISDHTDYPRMDFYRGKKPLQGHCFGPYSSAWAVRESISLLQKVFRIRQCEDSFFRSRTRPCLQYQIHRCTAPCVNFIDPPTYQQNVRLAILFLEGKNTEVIDNLVSKMQIAAEKLDYEQARIYRDQIALLRRLQEKQSVMNQSEEADVVVLEMSEKIICFQVIFIRAGQLLGQKSLFVAKPEFGDKAEILSSLLAQYYLQHAKEIPKKIILGSKVQDDIWLRNVLIEQSGHAVAIEMQPKAMHQRWLRLAAVNAKEAMNRQLAGSGRIERQFGMFQECFKLESQPKRLECFDISHTLGEATVASCVVFNEKGPLKSDYRRFNIKDITPGDDYAALRQALFRRYSHIKLHDEKLPDVLLIDGGKGQLHQAEIILEELQVSGVLLIGVAKGLGRKPGLETLFISGKNVPLHLPSDSPVLHLIQQIRDEAHRFAITGHRGQRNKARTTSYLENIPGIGANRRRQLLQQLGGIQEVKNASIEQLSAVKGISPALAEKIYAFLHEGPA